MIIWSYLKEPHYFAFCVEVALTDATTMLAARQRSRAALLAQRSQHWSSGDQASAARVAPCRGDCHFATESPAERAKIAEQVVALRFGITSALPSTPQRCIWASGWRVGVGTGDPKMNAEQAVALRFGITSAFPSSPQRCIWAAGWRVDVGTGDPKMSAEQVVAFRFSITSASLQRCIEAPGWRVGVGTGDFENECWTGSSTPFWYHQCPS